MKVSRRDFIKEVIPDEDPDLSWLGEFTSQQPDAFYIDRERGQYLGEEITEERTFPLVAEGGEYNFISGALPAPYDKLNLSEEDSEWLDCATDDTGEYQYDDEENPRQVTVTWTHREILVDGLATMGRHEHRYFVSTNYPVPGSDGEWKRIMSNREKPFTDAEEARFRKQGVVYDLEKHSPEFWLDVLYTCEDYERMTDYNRGEWCMNGVRAKVELRIPDKWNKNTFILQTIESPGLWGIESDGEDGYEDEVFKDECATLEHMLTELGVEITD